MVRGLLSDLPLKPRFLPRILFSTAPLLFLFALPRLFHLLGQFMLKPFLLQPPAFLLALLRIKTAACDWESGSWRSITADNMGRLLLLLLILLRQLCNWWPAETSSLTW